MKYRVIVQELCNYIVDVEADDVAGAKTTAEQLIAEAANRHDFSVGCDHRRAISVDRDPHAWQLSVAQDKPSTP